MTERIVQDVTFADFRFVVTIPEEYWSLIETDKVYNIRCALWDPHPVLLEDNGNFVCFLDSRREYPDGRVEPDPSMADIYQDMIAMWYVEDSVMPKESE